MSGQREDDALPDDGLTDYWPSEDELNETVELDTTMVDALLYTLRLKPLKYDSRYRAFR